MNGFTRLVCRSELAAAPMAMGRFPAIAGHKLVALWPGAWLLFGLLLALPAPAYGFEGEEPSSRPVHDLVVNSSGVPLYANWVVLDASGIAAWRAQGETRWQRFTRGEVLPPGCEIETGSDGEITLVAGGDQLMIAPQGRLIVPLAQPGQDRRLRHERGRILVQIESRGARDVRVDTPLLSLGIKGTTFEVLVEPEQDSVLVHEGDIEVTTPGQADGVDLRAGEGLRQPAAPGSVPTLLDLPAHEAPAGSADGPAWRLPPAGIDDAVPQETYGPPAEAAPAGAHTRSGREARDGSARERPAASDDWIDFDRLDELASSWGSIAIAAVGLFILTIPALALLQHLREQWLGRPKPTGQRRRQLVRG